MDIAIHVEGVYKVTLKEGVDITDHLVSNHEAENDVTVVHPQDYRTKELLLFTVKKAFDTVSADPYIVRDHFVVVKDIMQLVTRDVEVLADVSFDII